MCHSNKWFKKRFSFERLNETIWICRPCHRCLNALFVNNKQKELGKKYYTVELMLSHPIISGHVEWVKKHPERLTTK